MFASQSAKRMIAVLFIIVVVLLGVFIWMFFQPEPTANAEKSVDDLIARSYTTEEITTNLRSNDFVKLQLTIEADTEAGKIELEKRAFQINNILIHQLSSMDREAFKQDDSMALFEDMVKNKLNEDLQEGQVNRVYTTSFVLQ
ncbi:flagellar basal body-associated protein FliL [Bacillaceae bacterium SIJ1]|uniref:flagellar basal body-associated protein FliL n=1 Tax=Litoribacterium kuwaitense TaxID=1398745 RepID=UPI0013EDF8F8|nr:flagellar basal body-associated protein FliL [Litoribacterium kuwaitense]NGP44119.1 flagellar basal body-associated protein FliL [Litoribacterium kuwaitense]